MTGSTVSIRLRAYRGEQHDTTECFNGLRDEAADVIDSLIAERDRLRAEVALLNDANGMLLRQASNMEAERDRLRSAGYDMAQQIDALQSQNTRLRAEREQLAQMMIRQSLSTGHGDTVGDLVRELEPQIKRLRAEIVTLRNAAVNADERTDMLRGKLATAVLAHIDATAESDLLRVEVAALKKDAERNP